MTTLEAGVPPAGFTHEAFVYHSDDEYVATLAPLIAQAHAAGQATIIAVPHHRWDLLRRREPAAVSGSRFVDAATWYEHPITTIERFRAALREVPAGVRAFVVGEVQFGRSAAGHAAWSRYESAVNQVLHDEDATIICPYDGRLLPAEVVADARRTHPVLRTATGSVESAEYLEPSTLFARLPASVTAPSGPADVDLVVDGGLRRARRTFAAIAQARGLSGERTLELTLALSEVLTNGLLHGGGAPRLRIWSLDREIVCVIEDAGPGITDVLVGYRAPPTGSHGGYGTWLARRMFERAEFESTPDGLTVLLATDC